MLIHRENLTNMQHTFDQEEFLKWHSLGCLFIISKLCRNITNEMWKDIHFTQC